MEKWVLSGGAQLSWESWTWKGQRSQLKQQAKNESGKNLITYCDGVTKKLKLEVPLYIPPSSVFSSGPVHQLKVTWLTKDMGLLHCWGRPGCGSLMHPGVMEGRGSRSGKVLDTESVGKSVFRFPSSSYKVPAQEREDLCPRPQRPKNKHHVG